MLDIKLIREKPDLVRKNLEKRQDPKLLSNLDELVQADIEWRNLKQQNDDLRHERNQISQQINQSKKQGTSIAQLLEKAKQLPQKIKGNDENIRDLEKKIKQLLYQIPNLLDSSVPFGKDDSNNKVVRSSGKPKKPAFPLKHHGALAKELGVADFENAVKISGTGFFFLLGDLALLDLALQRFTVDLLLKKGFTLVYPPALMNRKAYEAVVSLSDFEDVMYKIENEDLYLIATSEHPLVSRFLGHTFREEELPQTFVGISPCFRREVGKHGLDERGFFRVHQFNKVEQIVLCKSKESPQFFEKIVKNAEEVLQKLKIPYRVTNVCTGDIGIIASKKFDVDGWSPRESRYIELMSCSNCTDYQSRRLNAKYFDSKGEKQLVHTLNATMLATARFLRIFIENHQTKKGSIKIPSPLWKYMNNKKEIFSPKMKKPRKKRVFSKKKRKRKK
ncbi:serine--tRNA ligase [Candidatus Micrarchaeota archaeon]|nr:serine--tRNA ligase [Candidatus Micrarchaeota archaeon]MBU1930825.1 serine--tRNA ligase [Candidatus Micrarchaeota archaeon]